MNRSSSFVRFSLLLATLALGLTACGGGTPATTWPGLVVDATQAFVTSAQQVHAINLSDGKEAWVFPPKGDNTYGSLSATPGLNATLLVIAFDGPTNEYSGAVFGVNLDTHQHQWCLGLDAKAAQRHNCPEAPTTIKRDLFSPATDNRVMGGIALVDNVAYFGLNSGMVYAVDATEGAVKWSFQAKQGVWAAPLVTPDSDLVYVGSLDHTLYALNKATGQIVWQNGMHAAIAGTPALNAGTLYVGTFGSKIYALEARTGAEKWTYATTQWVWDTPRVYSNTLYLTDVGGRVYALDAATGAEKWNVKPGEAARGAPAVTAEAVYVGDRAGVVHALNRETGAPLWTPAPNLKGQLLSAPQLAGELLLVAPYQGDNLLVAFQLNGTQKWAYAPGK